MEPAAYTQRPSAKRLQATVGVKQGRAFYQMEKVKVICQCDLIDMDEIAVAVECISHTGPLTFASQWTDDGKL